MMKYVKNLFLIIITGIYLIHSSFALGLWFLGHHEKNVDQNNIKTTQTCWSESESCCSTTNSCINLCVSEEYQTYSTSNLKLHDHNEQCDDSSLKYLSSFTYRLEALYIVSLKTSFSPKNIFAFDATDLVWIIKLTI